MLSNLTVGDWFGYVENIFGLDAWVGPIFCTILSSVLKKIVFVLEKMYDKSALRHVCTYEDWVKSKTYFALHILSFDNKTCKKNCGHWIKVNTNLIIHKGSLFQMLLFTALLITSSILDEILLVNFWPLRKSSWEEIFERTWKLALRHFYIAQAQSSCLALIKKAASFVVGQKIWSIYRATSY